MLVKGKRIKELRDALALKPMDVAHAADMSIPWLTALEGKDQHEVNRHVAAALAKFLGTTVKDIEAQPAQSGKEGA